MRSILIASFAMIAVVVTTALIPAFLSTSWHGTVASVYKRFRHRPNTALLSTESRLGRNSDVPFQPFEASKSSQMAHDEADVRKATSTEGNGKAAIKSKKYGTTVHSQAVSNEGPKPPPITGQDRPFLNLQHKTFPVVQGGNLWTPPARPEHASVEEYEAVLSLYQNTTAARKAPYVIYVCATRR
jgi:hypothetical protein